jgi:hypothetical protein
MKQLLEILNKKLAVRNKQIAKLEAKLAQAETGSLEVKKTNGVKRFFRHIKASKKYEYLGKAKLPVIKNLAQKRYDEDFLKLTIKQKLALEKCVQIINKPELLKDLDSVYEELPEDINKYVTQNILSHKGFIQTWQSQPDHQLNIPIQGNYYTAKGEHVRSKSEVIIADRLNFAGIPYRYELALNFPKTTMYPDFIVLNPRTLSVYAWEHFGLFDFTDYATSAKEKLELYAKNNYLLGKNLLATFETADSPLNMQHLDWLIKTYFK